MKIRYTLSAANFFPADLPQDVGAAGDIRVVSVATREVEIGLYPGSIIKTKIANGTLAIAFVILSFGWFWLGNLGNKSGARPH